MEEYDKQYPIAGAVGEAMYDEEMQYYDQEAYAQAQELAHQQALQEQHAYAQENGYYDEDEEYDEDGQLNGLYMEGLADRIWGDNDWALLSSPNHDWMFNWTLRYVNF